MNNYIHTEEIHNTKAAEEFIPILYEFIQPRSVIDIGCGLGTWLKIFQNQGCEVILGVDGNYVDKTKLAIDENNFFLHDLTKPLILNKKYELAACLEVAEHLPDEKSDILIKTLTSASDIILFSAALPKQGGQNHINEQPFSYWVKKFNDCGFVVKDTFRERIWENKNIDWWYRQNMFLVTKENINSQKRILDFYHPERYNELVTELNERLDKINRGNLKIFDAFKIFLKAVLRTKY